MAAGKEIKRLRESASKKISADYAASLIGVDVERLRKWEYRNADPFDTADKIKVEKYFGCPIDKLETLDNFQFYTPTNDRADAELEVGNDNRSTQEAISTTGSTPNDPIMQALLKLLDHTKEQTEINAKHANAADNNALARVKEAENNKELISIISLNARQGTSLKFSPIRAEILELLAPLVKNNLGLETPTDTTAALELDRRWTEIENRTVAGGKKTVSGK